MSDLPRASTLEGLRFTAQVAVPNLVQGLFRRRRRAVAVATRANADRHAVGLMKGLRRRYGPGPVWVRVGKDQVLVTLEGEQVREVLEGAPEPFAADPEAKRKGMSHFQPDALTISRGETWRNRRRFTEAVLGDAGPWDAIVREEVERLLASGGGEVSFEPLNECVRRIARRVVLGDSAADDSAVSEELAKLMDAANGLPGEPAEELPAYMERLERYVETAEPGSLVSRFAAAPHDAETRAAGQLPHWLFALGDTLAINLARALVLLAAHDDQRQRARGDRAHLEACLQEAMRLWPTTPMLSREAVADTRVGDGEVPAGSQVMIVNTFHHRDSERLDYADRFAPEAWTEGPAAQDWTLNHFSHGPQGCPGAHIALSVGTALLAALLDRHDLEQVSPRLDPSKPLPHMLDYFGIRARLGPLP